MIDIERRIFIDKNIFSISYPRFCATINNYTVYKQYINTRNENKTFSKRFRSFEECFAVVEQLREHQRTLEEFEKEIEELL